jgi:hypothetical protein
VSRGWAADWAASSGRAKSRQCGGLGSRKSKGLRHDS